MKLPAWQIDCPSGEQLNLLQSIGRHRIRPIGIAIQDEAPPIPTLADMVATLFASDMRIPFEVGASLP